MSRYKCLQTGENNCFVDFVFCEVTGVGLVHHTGTQTPSGLPGSVHPGVGFLVEGAIAGYNTPGVFKVINSLTLCSFN